MDLIIDIGNTSAKLVLFDKGEPVREVRTDNTTLAALPQLENECSILHAIVGTVVPLTAELEAMLKAKSYPVLFLTPDVAQPFRQQLYTPETLGADRLAAVIAATQKHPSGDLLIIDAGTCLTYELIVGGRYAGGTISPGARLRLQAMHEHTALLPLVSQEGELPEIGYDTDTALRCGALRGMQFEIEGYIRHFHEKYPSLLVFLTGGDGFHFDSSIKNIIIADKFLVPRGLNHILACNKQSFSAEA